MVPQLGCHTGAAPWWKAAAQRPRTPRPRFRASASASADAPAEPPVERWLYHVDGGGTLGASVRLSPDGASYCVALAASPSTRCAALRHAVYRESAASPRPTPGPHPAGTRPEADRVFARTPLLPAPPRPAGDGGGGVVVVVGGGDGDCGGGTAELLIPAALAPATLTLLLLPSDGGPPRGRLGPDAPAPAPLCVPVGWGAGRLEPLGVSLAHDRAALNVAVLSRCAASMALYLQWTEAADDDGADAVTLGGGSRCPGGTDGDGRRPPRSRVHRELELGLDPRSQRTGGVWHCSVPLALLPPLLQPSSPGGGGGGAARAAAPADRLLYGWRAGGAAGGAGAASLGERLQPGRVALDPRAAAVRPPHFDPAAPPGSPPPPLLGDAAAAVADALRTAAAAAAAAVENGDADDAGPLPPPPPPAHPGALAARLSARPERGGLRGAAAAGAALAAGPLAVSAIVLSDALAPLPGAPPGGPPASLFAADPRFEGEAWGDDDGEGAGGGGLSGTIAAPPPTAAARLAAASATLRRAGAAVLLTLPLTHAAEPAGSGAAAPTPFGDGFGGAAAAPLPPPPRFSLAALDAPSYCAVLPGGALAPAAPGAPAHARLDWSKPAAASLLLDAAAHAVAFHRATGVWLEVAAPPAGDPGHPSNLLLDALAYHPLLPPGGAVLDSRPAAAAAAAAGAAAGGGGPPLPHWGRLSEVVPGFGDAARRFAAGERGRLSPLAAALCGSAAARGAGRAHWMAVNALAEGWGGATTGATSGATAGATTAAAAGAAAGPASPQALLQLLILLLSAGTPLLPGDGAAFLSPSHEAAAWLAAQCAALRLQYPFVAAHNAAGDEALGASVGWAGPGGGRPAWEDAAAPARLTYCLFGLRRPSAGAAGGEGAPRALAVLLNGAQAAARFAPPPPPPGAAGWRVRLCTAWAFEEGAAAGGGGRAARPCDGPGGETELPPCSGAVLEAVSDPALCWQPPPPPPPPPPEDVVEEAAAGAAGAAAGGSGDGGGPA